MNDTSFGGGWLSVLVILVVLFGMGGGFFGGNNAAANFATTAEVQNSINSAFAQQNAQSILLSVYPIREASSSCVHLFFFLKSWMF